MSADLSTLPQLTRDEALALAETGWWKTCDAVTIASFQLHQDKLCCTFSDFHKAVETALGRPVFTHEFAFPESLRAELAGLKAAPSFEEIMNLIPRDKRVVVVLPKTPESRS